VECEDISCIGYKGLPLTNELSFICAAVGLQVQVADSVCSAAAILAAMTDAGPRGFCRYALCRST
jgi:hypothetical protein